MNLIAYGDESYMVNRDGQKTESDMACEGGKRNDMTKPEFIPKLREIQSLVIPEIKQALGPLFFATSLEKKKGNVIDNGSFAYVATHQKNLLVTCHHVWNGFLEERARNPGLKLCGCFDDRTPVPFCTLRLWSPGLGPREAPKNKWRPNPNSAAHFCGIKRG
jgi:hypothetical protein